MLFFELYDCFLDFNISVKGFYNLDIGLETICIFNNNNNIYSNPIMVFLQHHLNMWEEKFLGFSSSAASYSLGSFGGHFNLIGTFSPVKELGRVEIALNLSQPFSFNGAGFKILPKLRLENFFERTPLKKINLSAFLL